MCEPCVKVETPATSNAKLTARKSKGNMSQTGRSLGGPAYVT